MKNTFQDDLDYLTKKFRAPEFDPSTGLDNDTISARLQELLDQYADLPHPVAKAKLFSFLADNLQIDANSHDWFPGFACWNRDKRPLGCASGRWARELSCGELEEVERKTNEGNREGIFSIWKDFDHSVPDWDRILKLGFPGVLKCVRDYRKKREENGNMTADQNAYFEGIDITYTAILRMIERFRMLALSRAHGNSRLLFMADSLQRLHDGEPQNTFDVLMFEYLYFIFSEHMDILQVRSLGNFDRILYPYFIRDIREKRFTKEDIREFLDYFLMQWGSINNYWGQPVFMGGTKEDGSTIINEFSYLVLDELDKLRLPTPKFQLKIAENTPEKFISQALKMVREWNASLVFVCEPGLRRMLTRFGYSEEEARTCDLKGCYEYSIRGKYNGTAPAHINMLKMVELALNNGINPATGVLIGAETGDAASFKTFDDFMSAYLEQAAFVAQKSIEYVNGVEHRLKDINPTNVFSATIENSLAVARDAFEDGCVYNNTNILIVGLGSTVDALSAIRKYVFDAKELSLAEFRDILRRNWDGAEKLRLKILNDPDKYGNNRELPDSIMLKVASFISNKINKVPNRRGGTFAASVHSAKRYIEFGKLTGATPDGRFAGEEMSKNLSPVMGMDRNGVTALVNSMTKVDSSLFPADFPLDIMLHPTTVRGDEGLLVMHAVLKAYLRRNGVAVHFNIFSADELLEAQKNPPKYAGLQVRVCGWNTHFTSMSKKEQDAYIIRAQNIAG